MASTNQSPFYQKAEAQFLSAQTDEERIKYLEEMIKECPKHKSSEKMLAQLRTRYKKLKEKIEKGKKSRSASGAGRRGIKKEDMQAVIIGFSNSGKSSLLSKLTNASPEIAQYKFTTKMPSIGMMNFQSTNIQIIEIPAIDSEYYDRSLVNTADTIIILVTNMEDIEKISKELERAQGKKIIVFNNKPVLGKILDERKISATLKSKKYNFEIVDLKERKIPEELKEKIFKSFGKIRVLTKEPGKPKSENPIVLEEGSTVKDVAEKILHGFSNKVKETFVTGPSSKFPNQRVGLKHVLKDLDIVEFRVK